MKSDLSTQLIVVSSGPPARGTVGSVPLDWVKKFRKKPLRRAPKRKKQK